MADVLIVDDDPTIRRTLSRILGEMGHEAVTVPGGAEAVEVVAERRFDLGIVDLRLPGMSGTALMTWLRKEFPGIRLIMMSAVLDLLKTPDDFLAEASLTKPFAVEDVWAVVGRTLEAGPEE